MTERLELYKCKICGNLVEVVLSGVGELVCCNEPMQHLDGKTNDNASNEKHVPVFIDKGNNTSEVRVGAQPHPMEKEHYIQFIETISEDKNFVQRMYLYPTEDPVMKIDNNDKIKIAREFCNIHELWENPEIK
ncbi:MAG: desulfoferrodoxin FeS4 iron-binding domain-containing protein [Candidatus Gastranaerophilaceae bacterium]